MTSNKDKIIKKIIDGFQVNRGKASFYCFEADIVPDIIYNVIVPFEAKHKGKQIFIVVDNYNTRVKILTYLKSKGISEEKGYNIKILSASYINSYYKYDYKLSILVGVNKDIKVIKHIERQSDFTLCILTENIMMPEFINNVRSILPNIDIAINKDDSERIYSPVEEYRIGILLSDKNQKVYNAYTDYITESLKILGNVKNIELCKKGDDKLNISAAEFRNNLAHENGWSENLDTTIPFMKSIDDIYNPNVIYERAVQFYTMAKNRKDLVTDSEDKLDKIYQICYENRDKRILIISKRGEYAAKVTEYINNRAEAERTNLWCRDYHDCLDTKPLFMFDGSPILYKSGSKKGTQIFAGWQKQSSINEELFNDHCINILSIKSASNPKLKIAIDIVILTSSLCDNIIDVRRRFTNVQFKCVPTKVYRIYSVNTIENDLLNKEKENSVIKIINDNENNFVAYDENSGDIIL